MMAIDLLDCGVYAVPQSEKEKLLLEQLNALSDLHRMRCASYASIVDKVFHGKANANSLNEVPYIPASLFKTHKLCSVPDEQIYRALSSSGTAGRQSQIYLDRETAQSQTVALSKIIGSIAGANRLPMLIIDCEATIRNRDSVNARAAGILGMMNFGRQHVFALRDNDMSLDIEALAKFLSRFGGEPFLIYGFTFMIWQYFRKQIAAAQFDLTRGTLIHSGGWKKLNEEKVSNENFKLQFKELTGLSRIYNFYGMVEQIGSVFLEGEDGFLYPPSFADVIVRNPKTWEEAKIGEEGVIQVLSILPRSYPGHSILTEDIGVIHGIDDSTCGRKGKRFTVTGRAPKVELRGCSDVHAYGS